MNRADDKTIGLMLRKAEEKLITAQIDFDNQRYNDSVSRVYYGVFHAISAVLLSKGLHFSTHSQVIGNFNKEFVKKKDFPKSFTKIVQRLFEERQAGDYDFDSEITKESAEINLKDSQKIVGEIKIFLQKNGYAF